MSKLGAIFLIVSVCVVLSQAEPGILQRIKNKVAGPLVKREPEVIVKHEVVVVEERCKSDRCKTCRNDCSGNEKCYNDCVVIEKCRNGCNGNERCQNDCGWGSPPRTEYVVVEERTCKSERCKTCRNDCRGNDKCYNECVVIEKCRNGCKGNERCQNDCGWGPKTEYVVIEERSCKSERCRACRNECNGNDRCHDECISIEKCRNGCRGNERCQNDCGWGPPALPPPPHYFENDRCRGCSRSCQNDDRPLLTFCAHGLSLSYVQVSRAYLADFVSNPDLLQLYNNSNMELDANGLSGRVCLNDKARLDLNRLNAVIMPVNHT